MGALIKIVVAVVAFGVGVSLSTGSGSDPGDVSAQALQGPMLYIAAAAFVAIGLYMFKTVGGNAAASLVATALMLTGAGIFLGPLIFGPPAQPPGPVAPVVADRPLTAPPAFEVAPPPPPPGQAAPPPPPPPPAADQPQAGTSASENWAVDLPVR